MLRRFLFFSTLLISLAPGARAQTAQPSSDPVTIHESVVVTATGRDTPESNVGATISVLERRDIEQRHALSTIDLLRTIPGVVAVRSGGVGNLTGVFVRGGESTYNKVLLDGMPLNEPGGAFNFASLSPESIERIELLRGAHSALFGSDAMASVIQLFSVRPEMGRPRVNLTVDAGNFDTGHAAAGVGGRTRGFAYSLFGSHLQTDNEEPNNRDKTSAVSGMVTRQLESGASLRFLGRGDFGQVGTPGPTAFGGADMDARFTHDAASLLSGWNQPLGSRVTQQASYSLVITNYRSSNLVTDPPFTPRFGSLVGAFPSSDFLYDSETELDRHHVEYRADAALGRSQTLTAAFAFDAERGILTDHLSTQASQRPGRNNSGTTIQYEAAASRASLVGGVRFENNGSFGFYAAPRVAVSWLAGSGRGQLGTTRLRASAGLGIKEPLFIQSFSLDPGFLGNPDLNPEKSRGFDVGLEQRFAADRVSVEAIYFANHFDDLISLGPYDASFNARYENVGETRGSGLELVGAAVVAGSLHIGGSYTFLDSKVIKSISSSAIFAPGKQLYRRPRHSGALQLSYAHNRLSLALGAIFVGSRVDGHFYFPTLLANDGYATWNATGDVRIAPRTSIFVTFDNLADREYMEPLGYPGLGRTVRVGIRTRF